MTPIARIIFLSLFLFSIQGYTQAQKAFDKKYTIKADTFPSGNLKKVTETWLVKYNKKPGEQDEFYRKETIKVVEYFDSGQTKSITKKIVLIGTFGRACAEPVYKQKVWYANGKKKYYELRRCDLQKSIIIDYNKKGKILSKTIVKKPYKTNNKD